MSRCTATAKSTQQPCARAAIAGGTVCRVHGGAAPQVQAKARERLAALIHPALSALGELVTQTEAPAVRLGAVKDVLDRTGVAAPAGSGPIGGFVISWLPGPGVPEA